MKRLMFQFLTMFAILHFFNPSDLLSQQSINSGSANINSPNGQISFSIGQLNYKVDSNFNANISSGIQQVYELSTPSSIYESPKVNINVFPNPVQNILTIECDYKHSECFYYELFSTKGQFYQFSDITTNRTQIDISFLISGSYILSVKNGNGSVIKSFIISKM